MVFITASISVRTKTIEPSDEEKEKEEYHRIMKWLEECKTDVDWLSRHKQIKKKVDTSRLCLYQTSAYLCLFRLTPIADFMNSV